MTNWNSFEDSERPLPRQDAAYQNGVFDDYALPNRQYDRGYDNRSNLAMSVSLGPADFLLGNNGISNSRSSNYFHHREQFTRQPYLTPDYNYRRGYEDFGESTYMLHQGRPQMRFSDTFRRDMDDQGFSGRPSDTDYSRRRSLQWDMGDRYDSSRERYPVPYVRDDYRSYDEEREPVRVEARRAPEREYVQRDYVEQDTQIDRSRDVQTDDRPSRTLPSSAMSEYDWAVYTKLCETAKDLVGKHTKDYDNRLPSDRLGCVKAVSMLVDKALGYNTNDVNTRTFEKDLRNKGFSEVAVSDIKPGDVILGYRANGDYSHSALYMGNGKIFNNDSDLGTMAIQSIDKFNSTEYKRFVILRHPPEVPAVTPGSIAPHTQISLDDASGPQVVEDNQTGQSTARRPVLAENSENRDLQTQGSPTQITENPITETQGTETQVRENPRAQTLDSLPADTQQRRPAIQERRSENTDEDLLSVPNPDDDFSAPTQSNAKR